MPMDEAPGVEPVAGDGVEVVVAAGEVGSVLVDVPPEQAPYSSGGTAVAGRTFLSKDPGPVFSDVLPEFLHFMTEHGGWRGHPRLFSGFHRIVSQCGADGHRWRREDFTLL